MRMVPGMAWKAPSIYIKRSWPHFSRSIPDRGLCEAPLSRRRRAVATRKGYAPSTLVPRFLNCHWIRQAQRATLRLSLQASVLSRVPLLAALPVTRFVRFPEQSDKDYLQHTGENKP